ncbi:MBL fold metallo-hydrolase [Micrococcales bacterium 31B]|nr:MBL fold metallo-hydrolase [Micrococcales bacterium 31B]
MKLQHYGHACFTVDIGTTRLIIDPGNFSPQAGAITGAHAIFVTHQHADHADPATLRALHQGNPGIPLYAEPQAAEILRAEGIECRDVRPGDIVEVGDVTVTGVGGLHEVIHPSIPRVQNTGFVITSPGEKRLGVTGDSQEPCPEFHEIDALAFAITAPWTSVGAMIDALVAVAPRQAIPVHDAVASPPGRAIAVRLLTGLLPEGSVLTDWPESKIIEI